MKEELKIESSEKPIAKLCSFLIPSRGRPKRCVKAIESILTASDNQCDVLVRIDTDDPYLEEYRKVLTRENVTFFEDVRVGFDGGASMVSFLADQTNSKWICIFNDDMTLEGSGFVEKLSAVPIAGYIVQQANHILGGSNYPRFHGGPAPIVPNQCWRDFGRTDIAMPCDTYLDQELRVKHGWKTWWLDGIAVNHQRDSGDLINKHRL